MKDINYIMLIITVQYNITGQKVQDRGPDKKQKVLKSAGP